MKIELGKTKIKGFKFTDGMQGCLFLNEMNNYIGKEGVIVKIIHDWLGEKVRVKFDNYTCDYPACIAEDYIVEEETVFYSIGVPYNKLFLDFNPKGCGIIEEIKDIFTKHQNKNNMKNLKITAPEGYEIDKTNSTFENIVFKPIKKELPKSWDELITINGHCTTSDSGIISTNSSATVRVNKNIFANKEQAEASIALAQLSQLREAYRDGWKPNYKNKCQTKFTIYFREGMIETNEVYHAGYFLSFQSAEVRDLFLENFRDLIEQAKPLIS